MDYCLVNRSTGRIVTDSNNRQGYKTPAAAKAGRTRLIAKGGYVGVEIVILPREDLQTFRQTHNLKTTTERVNLMTGEKFLEDVDTPRCCSPSSETFWSM